MAYTVENLQVGMRREEKTHGTGTGTLYVTTFKSADGVVDVVKIYSTATPSTTDTYAIGSEWTILGNGDFYLKTGATTWTKQD